MMLLVAAGADIIEIGMPFQTRWRMVSHSIGFVRRSLAAGTVLKKY